MDKPVFLIAAITLAILFIALFFAASSSWLNDTVSQFTSSVDKVSTGGG